MKRISPFTYHGRIQSCTSKSHAQRILILGALSKSDVFIEHLFEAELGADVQDVMNVCRKLGYTFSENKAGTQMTAPSSFTQLADTTFSIGESGFALRALSTILSAFMDTYTIEGHKTILTRDHKGLIASLKSTGFEVDSENNGLPIKISHKGNFNSTINIDGSQGSQFISGLLMLSPFLDGVTEVRVSNLTSRPYIDLTRHTIQQFNGVVKGTDSEFIIPGNQKLTADSIALEGDWSNVSFHLVGAALNGEISVSGLNMNSFQADKIILDILEKFGAKFEFNAADEIIVSSASKNPIQVNLTDAPDLFPVLSVLACGATGASALKGTDRLINKESNRLRSICEMLDVFGVQHQLAEGTLLIFGTGSINGGNIKTYNDHRMAMAAICAAAISSSDIIIDNRECIQKSYRNYFIHMDSILNNES